MPFSPRSRHRWQTRTRTLELGERTLIMGILNITPDSFSDGGQFFSTSAATDHGLRLLDLGADILDLGAESTRPNAIPLSPEEEQERLLPVLEAIRNARPQAILSVDTYHSSTAEIAINAGAEIINDVSGLTWDRAMAGAIAASDPPPGLVLMHTRGTPQQWRQFPPLDLASVPAMVRDELSARLRTAEDAGIPPNRILLDPGFGFGKLGDENLFLLARLSSLHSLGLPLLVGLSRKSFLLRALGPLPVGTRPASTSSASQSLHASVAANTAAILAGAHVIRVHDVPAAVEAASIADTILAHA